MDAQPVTENCEYEMVEVPDERGIVFHIMRDGDEIGELIFRRSAQVEWTGDNAQAIRAMHKLMSDKIAPVLKREGIETVWATTWASRKGLHKFLERMKFLTWTEFVNVSKMEVSEWLEPKGQAAQR